MKPTIGRIVHYRLTENDAKTINDRRRGPYGSIGNAAAAGDVVPLIITAVWPSEYAGTARLADHPEGVEYESTVGVNGQAFLDGNDSLWICSAPEGALNGCWCWPPRETVPAPAPTVPVVEETPKAPAPEPRLFETLGSNPTFTDPAPASEPVAAVAAPVVADPAVPSSNP